MQKAIHPSWIKAISPVQCEIQLEADGTFSYQHYFTVKSQRYNCGIPISGWESRAEARRVASENISDAEAVKEMLIREGHTIIDNR